MSYPFDILIYFLKLLLSVTLEALVTESYRDCTVEPKTNPPTTPSQGGKQRNEKKHLWIVPKFLDRLQY